MRSRDDPDLISQACARFWTWFAPAVATRQSFDDEGFIDELEGHLRQIDPRLSWEIGPGETQPHRLAISPSLRSDLVPVARQVARAAPRIRGWEVVVGRPQRIWRPVFTIVTSDGESRDVDATDWRYALLRYEDGSTELVVLASNLELAADDRWTAVALVVESLLGELNAIDLLADLSIEQEVDPLLLRQMKPITDIAQVMVRRTI